jgi:hypothetical protein
VTATEQYAETTLKQQSAEAQPGGRRDSNEREPWSEELRTKGAAGMGCASACAIPVSLVNAIRIKRSAQGSPVLLRQNLVLPSGTRPPRVR